MKKDSIYWLDFREKMDGANLYDGNIEGTFELWIERNVFRIDTTGGSPVIKETA